MVTFQSNKHELKIGVSLCLVILVLDDHAVLLFLLMSEWACSALLHEKVTGEPVLP